MLLPMSLTGSEVGQLIKVHLGKTSKVKEREKRGCAPSCFFKKFVGCVLPSHASVNMYWLRSHPSFWGTRPERGCIGRDRCPWSARACAEMSLITPSAAFLTSFLPAPLHFTRIMNLIWGKSANYLTHACVCSCRFHSSCGIFSW